MKILWYFLSGGLIIMSTVKDKITIQYLISKGFPITPGNKYIPKSMLPKRTISLHEIHKRLSKIKGNLDEEIYRIREKN